MKSNKTSSLFKGFLGKEKTEDPIPLSEMETNEKEAESTVAETVENDPWAIESSKRDLLYRLYCKWCWYEKRPIEHKLFAHWMKEPLEQSAIESESLMLYAEMFRKKLLLSADEMLQKIEAADAEDLSEVPPDIDASVHIYVTAGNMTALLCVLPPTGNGVPLDKTLLDGALNQEGITNGIINETAERIVKEQCYFQIFPIAVGIPPLPGTDGKIIEHIPRKEILNFQEDEMGRVDFKELHLFRNIQKGDRICDIIPPKKGTNGLDVKGNVREAPDGKKAIIPAGNHTAITPDGLKLVADMDGYISFQNGKFRVEDQLIINGNVDMSVGNQDFLGDIIVYGDVISGFSLKATGNIYVKGFVEGAVLTAGENIKIIDGMNGSNCGELHAGGSIQSAFLENVKVYAAGNVSTQSMISCEVRTHGSIQIDQGIGVLIGGILTAGRSVKAKTIGSKAYRKTELFIGMTPEIRDQKKEKADKLEETRNTRTLLKKNIRFLQSIEPLPNDKAELLKQLIEQEKLYGQIEQQFEQELTKLKEISSYRNCFVQSDTIYPPVRITIGAATYSIDTTSTNCKLYLSEEGNIVLGVE